MRRQAGDTSGLEEEDSFVDIDDTPGTRCDQEGGIRGTGLVGKRVEVVTRSGRRAGVLYTVNDAPRLVEKQGLVDIPVKYVKAGRATPSNTAIRDLLRRSIYGCCPGLPERNTG